MLTKWTSHLKTEEDKANFQNEVLRSKHILDHVKTMVKEIETDLDKQEINPRAYDLPNWDYRQAHSNGYRQCLSHVLKILTLDPEEKK